MIILLGYLLNAPYMSQSLYGVFLADLSLGRHLERLVRPGDLPNTRELPVQGQSEEQPTWAKIYYSLLFVLGISILGQPDYTDLDVWGQFP